ncbi:segregation/condensation protein A [Mycoplasma crocodyli]|uniref:Segregation and condensation protein A n=1 Tax=Mycoplasma crocodyli (strain ATCC 51981 / MP145) TaxID=512564 RepID=D5E5U6_MYCCM|nr:segregation/condensation protein A [Mycoplasma crocodyli]ADE19631.1 chromosomal segregation and condensation complex, ScpA protein [Mycoplasma crocodyli MP145]
MEQQFFNDSYNIKLDDFDGPLDLLLSLVQDKKVDIMTINLAELATQYLEIINNLKESQIDIAGDYLVMAATLIQIKARMLLKEPEEVDEELEEDSRAILQRLAEYQQFKEVSGSLRENELLRKDIFIKKPSTLEEYIVDKDSSKLDGNSNPYQLINVLRKMFERMYALRLRRTKLETFTLTPKDQEAYIKDLFLKYENVTFEMIFTLPSLNHFVITLVALLDLARKQEILITQTSQFGEILINKGPEYEK